MLRRLSKHSKPVAAWEGNKEVVETLLAHHVASTRRFDELVEHPGRNQSPH
jgi:hypothetical protein